MAQQKFVDSEGLKVLSSAIMNGVNTRITERIATTVDAADETHVPSGKAVSTAIAAAIATVGTATAAGYQVVVGAIDTITEPDEKLIYLQKDDEADTTLQVYVYSNGEWITTGATTDIELTTVTSEEVTTMFAEVMTATDPGVSASVGG